MSTISAAYIKSACWLACTICVLLALVSIAPAAVQQYQYSATCTDCHKMPPVDAAYRNVTTGGFMGSHFTHNPPSVAPAVSCEKCHFGSSSYVTSHMNDFVNMTSNINASPHPSKGTYNKPRFFNQTSNPVVETCSNVNCHFEAITPAWSSTQFASPDNCNGCHGAPPSDGSHPAASGSGKKHGDYYTTTTSSCVKCHPDHTAESAPFSHATSAGHRGLIVTFTTDLNGGFGRYTGNVGYPFYLPSQSPPRNGTCRDIYCHSPGTKSSDFNDPNSSAVWGGTLDCKGCHRSNSTSGAPMATGSHGKHVNGGYSAYACVKCHAATATVGMTIATTGNHVNGLVNIAYNNSTTAVNGTYNGSASPMTKAPGSGYGTCTNTYCHSTVQPDGGSGAPTYTTTPAWGSGTYLCGQCHQDGSSHMGDGVMASGSHTKHLSYQFQTTSESALCAICHNLGAATFTANAGCFAMNCHGNNGVVTKHANHNVDVLIPAYFGGSYDGTPAPGDGYGSCSGVYCHSDGQSTLTYSPAAWGESLDCTGCHGSATSNGAGGSALSGKHQAHVNNEAVLGAGNSFHCIDCHRATVSSDATIASTTAHVNKLIDYTGVRAGGPLRYDGTSKVCSNFYCHSNGNRRALVLRSMTGSKAWTGSATLGCNGCHGNEADGEFATSTTGAPNYPSGGAGSNTANSHKRHVNDSGITSTTGCATCHVKTADGAVNGRFKDYTAASYHLDGSADINFKNIGGDTGVLNADRSCSSTYCHGAAASPKWGETNPAIVPLACNRCHSANNNGAWAAASAHKIHWESNLISPTSYINYSGNVSSADRYRFTCSSCHSPKSAAHATGPVNANRVAEVFFSISSAGMKGSYTDAGSVSGTDNGFPWTAGTTGCNTTYCHSNGRGGNGLAAVAWSATTRSGSCVQCHDAASSTVTPTGLSGKHDRHMNPANNPLIGLGNGFGCVQCHAETVNGSLSISDKSKHVNRMLDYSGARAGGSARYNSATKQCTNIYCHSDGNTGAIVYVNPAAWTSGTSLGCNGCHGITNPATGAPDYINGGAGTTTANSHTKHLAALSIADTTGCSACHVKTVNTTSSARFKDYSASKYHLDETPSVNMAPGYGGSYNAATSTCSGVSCHSNGRGGYQPVQWGTVSNCGLCHPMAGLSASHAKHVNIATLPVFYTMTGNRSTAAVYNFGCSNCHLLDNSNHMNGTVVLDMRPAVAGAGTLRSRNNAAITAAGTAGTANSGTTGDSVPGSVVKCLNVYCHSNGYGADIAYATTPNWHGGTFTGDRCANCHGNSPNSTIAGSPAHYNGNWLGQGGAGGHLGGIHFRQISKHPTGPAVAGTDNESSHGNAATATTISCSVCHYATVTSPRNDGNMVCVTCHYEGNSVGAQTGNPAAIADKSKHVDGTVDVAFQPVTILSKAQIREQSRVLSTYSSVWTRTAGYKQAGSHDSAKTELDTTTMWNGATKTCLNVACHNGQSVKWNDTGGTTTCVSCHSVL